MWKKIIQLLILLTAVCLFGLNSEGKAAEQVIVNKNPQEVSVFCYHNIVRSGRGDLSKILKKDPYVTTDKRLEEHFQYFKENGYHPISMQQYKDYVENKTPLPKNPVMITFDDGNESMYTLAYPLLKKYHYPAVFSIVLSFMEMHPNPNLIEKMVSWDQVQEMEASGLVTMASHSYALHNYVNNTSYGDRFENAGTVWWNEKNTYQTEAEYLERIDNDFILGKRAFEKGFGYKSNVITWPYGMYNQKTAEIANKHGYAYQLLLNDDKKNADPHMISRWIVWNNPDVKKLEKMLQHQTVTSPDKYGQLDLDSVYDPLPEQFERNLDRAIEKFYYHEINNVIVQTFEDKDGDGNVKSVYFYNTQVPVKANILGHVISRLQRGGVRRVYAWLPLLSYDADALGIPKVVAEPADKLGWYTRLSPFAPQTKQFVHTLVHDLTLYNSIDGILFQDDLYLNDFEDYSQAAKVAFKDKFKQELTSKITNNKELMQTWTRYKTATLTDLTKIAIEEAKIYRPEIKSARNIYSALLENPKSEEWFAQNFEDYLRTYDYTVVMAYPEMEKADDPLAWDVQIVDAALKKPENAEKVIFKIQCLDWDKRRWLTDSEIWARESIMQKHGAKVFGFYPVNAQYNRDR